MHPKLSTLVTSVFTFTAFTNISQVAIASQAASAAPVSSDHAPATGKNEPGLTNWQLIQKRAREAREARLKREANVKAKIESSETPTQDKKTHPLVTQESPPAEKETTLKSVQHTKLNPLSEPKKDVEAKAHVKESPTSEPSVMSKIKEGCVENPSDFKGTWHECMICLEKAEKEADEIFHKVCDAKMNYYYGEEGWGTKKPSEKETQEYQDINKQYNAAEKVIDGWYAKLNELSGKGPHLDRGPRPMC